MMLNRLNTYIDNNRDAAHSLLRRFLIPGRFFFLGSDLLDEIRNYADETKDKGILTSPLGEMLHKTQEVASESPWLYFAVRPRVARWFFVKLHMEVMKFEEITASDFFQFKEKFVTGSVYQAARNLEIDLGPFERGFPKLKESRSIGRGVEFLNRHLSGRMFDQSGNGVKGLLDFLHVHKYRGMQLMLNDRIGNVADLTEALRDAEEFLLTIDHRTDWSEIAQHMQMMGFEPGWGRTVGKVLRKINLLADILEAPDYLNLEQFLAGMPMIFNIAVLSPHGYFGQANVLGLPDTGGQVVYILDQIRALEKEMRQRLFEEGLDITPQLLVVTRLIQEAGETTCNQRIEPIIGTENAKILRIPFFSPDGEIIPHWISRFKIWPYLERFAADAEREILAELGKRPDLIIGNYSDGNLVAYLLSSRLGVTQCNIAHALEKTKYLYFSLLER